MNIFFNYHPDSMMYVWASGAFLALTLVIHSPWYTKHALRNADSPNAKIGQIFYNRLKFASKGALGLAIFCFFMSNFNQQSQALVLAASCSIDNPPYYGTLYLENLSVECKSKLPSRCFKEFLSKSKKAKDENLQDVKMRWTFTLIENKTSKGYSAQQICQKQNLEKLMQKKVLITRNLMGTLTVLEALEVE